MNALAAARVRGSSPAASIVREFGRLGLLTVVVAVLTVLFNLVGTLCVSVIAGMMAGASRRFNWQVVSMSLIPPAVALVLGYFTNVEFDQRQWLTLPAVCLGSFWGIWLATCVLMLLEKKSEPALNRASRSRDPGGAHSGAVASHDANGSDAVSDEDKVQPCLTLDQLEGTWVCESDRSGETSTTKSLVIKQGRISLHVVNERGQTRVVARGQLGGLEADGKERPGNSKGRYVS